MMQSLVDYVLERGNKDYGQFAPKDNRDPNIAVYNHRKLLEFLFHEDQQTNHLHVDEEKVEKRISDLKLEEISGQLNYFSQKIHAELSKKQLTLDGDLYKLENEWLRKKMPDFYCYYFLKFAYANSYSRMHQLFLSEMQNMNRDKDSYNILKKTIEARQSCLSNLRKSLHSIKDIDVQQSLQMIKQQRELKRKAQVSNAHKDYKERGQQGGKSWKNELQVLFENINHYRKLSCYVVQLIKMWKTSIYNISDDPRRYRERVIFYHHDANYLLKILFDGDFIKESFLKKYLLFNKRYDPFLLKPAMHLEKKKSKGELQEIFFDLIRPSEADMDKITKALVILAEQEYDEDQQSRFINERKNFGELEYRKQFIERRRDTLGIKKNQSEKVIVNKPSTSKDTRQGELQKITKFTNDKKAPNTQKQLEQVKTQRDNMIKKSRIETSLNRLKQMRSIDLKKVSPYLSRNQRIEKAQKVIELQHKFRVAQSQYVDTVKKKQSQDSKSKIKDIVQASKQTMNQKIFNRYIEQNLKLMDQATKKAFLYKNQSEVNRQRISSDLNYNKIPFHNRKQVQYERNLQTFYPKQQAISPMKKPSVNKGTKSIIEISNKGVRANEKIIQFQLSNKKGKNIGEILNKRQNSMNQQATYNKLSPELQRQSSNPNSNNLFESQKQPQILIYRQEPQKLQQIKQFLYKKIKQQLIEQMKKNEQNKELSINNMIQQQKRRKLQEIIDERKRQEQRKRQQQQRLRLARLQRQRKKMSLAVRVSPIQYAQQNAQSVFNQIFSIQQNTYHRLFTIQKINLLKEDILNHFYFIILKAYHQNEQVGYCILHYNWEYELHRKFTIDYLVLKENHYYMSTLYQVIEYMWNNDPVEEVQMIMYKNMENSQGLKIIEDVDAYAAKSGQIFEKDIYSNVSQQRYVWMRDSDHNLEFKFKNYYFGKLINFKAELLSSSISLHERHTPKIEMTLEVFTNYIFLLEELFRKYLTPEEVVQLRQNSLNIRRLKDIFRIVLDLEKTNPIVDELVVVQGINLQDMYAKLKEKKIAPYDKYYWHHFYDKTNSNRILLSVLEFKLDFKYKMQSCKLNDRNFIRFNCQQKILVLRSSIYAQQNIYILDTHNPKIKAFLMDGQHFKLMRMELFIFLNLIFNNIVEDQQKFINCIWAPQFTICDGSEGKQVKRITDFSISMKKSFFLSEEIYFANYEYIKHGLSLIPKQGDVIFRQSLIVGFLHTEVEQVSTGMPIYAKLIDKREMFEK